MTSEEREATVTGMMMAWLRTPDLYGCLFARHVAKSIRLGVYLNHLHPGLLADLTAYIERCAEQSRFALAVFPFIETEDELVDLINRLVEADRWTASELGPAGGQLLVELLWTNQHGHHCNAAGFAPLGTMPVTRRAPFFAIGLWPGGHDNEFLKKPGKAIGLADTAHGLEREAYDVRLKRTGDDVERLCKSLDAPDRQVLRQTAFRLTSRVRSALRGIQ